MHYRMFFVFSMIQVKIVLFLYSVKKEVNKCMNGDMENSQNVESKMSTEKYLKAKCRQRQNVEN